MPKTRSFAFQEAPASWEVSDILGRGAYGDVRCCLIGGKKYAVKSQKLGRRNVGTLAKQIIVEHDIGVAATEDTSLVRVIGVEVCGSTAFTVMPLYGPSVQSLLKGQNTFTENDAAELAADLGAALDALHRVGVVHRDVKLANIMTNPSSQLGRSCYVLGDYGVSNIASVAVTCIGTPYNMAPELHTPRPYTESVDIWGAGCCLYEVLFCRVPFDARTPNQLKTRASQGLSVSQKKNILAAAPTLGKTIVDCLSVHEFMRPKAAELTSAAHDFIEGSGREFTRANCLIEFSASECVSRMRRALPGSLRAMCRNAPVSQKSSVPALPPLALGMEATPSTPVKPQRKRRQWGPVVPLGEKPLKYVGGGICHAVAHRPGRTHDFDAAKRCGTKVEGYRYLGKVYVTHVSQR